MSEKLTIPQIAEELKRQTVESPSGKLIVLDYNQLAELSGWTKEEMAAEGTEDDADAFFTAISESAEVCVYFGYCRILSEVPDEECWMK